MGSPELWQRSSESLLAELRATETQLRQAYATSVELIAELESRDIVGDTGYPSLPALLRDVLCISVPEAKRRVEHARAVTETPLVSGGSVPAVLPLTAVALREGAVGAEHVEVIRAALSDLPHVSDDDRAAAEETLVTAARSMDARTLKRVADRLRAVLDQDGLPPDERELAEPSRSTSCTW